MSDGTNPDDRVRQVARMAAAQFTDVNDACPYPFHTQQARIFKAEFALARADQMRQQVAYTTALCECDLEVTVQELECGRCSSCGKAVPV